jgi:hypothetical protein
MQFLFSSEREDSVCQFFVNRLVMVPRDIDWSVSVVEQLEREIGEAEEYIERLRQGQPHKVYEAMKKTICSDNEAI